MSTFSDAGAVAMRRTAALIAMALLPATVALGAAEASAQYVTPGAARVEMSDLTVPSVAATLLFDPGTVKTFQCPVAWGVRTAADSLAGVLSGSVLRAIPTAGRAPVPSARAQGRVLEHLSGVPTDDFDAFVASLVPGGRDPARGEATALAHRLDGLFSDLRGMDPLAPGHVAPTRFAAAVHEWDVLLGALDEETLVRPSDELLTLQSVLASLVLAALENEGRGVDDPSLRGEYGLPCAPPPRTRFIAELPEAPEPPPPLERPIVVCVLEDDRFQDVPAVLLPETGDTLALVVGERVPFAGVHPDRNVYAGAEEWFLEEAPVELAGVTWVPWAHPRTTDGLPLVRVGEVRGVAAFAAPEAARALSEDGTAPPALWLPVRNGCVVQEYRPVAAVRRTRG